MLKYNSVWWGSERRTFPWNCQKLHWNPQRCPRSDHLWQMWEVPALSYFNVFSKASAGLSPSGPFIHVRLWHQGTQQCPVWCGCRNNGQVTCLCTQTLNCHIEALPLCCQQCIFDLKYTSHIPGSISLFYSWRTVPQGIGSGDEPFYKWLPWFSTP